MKQSVTVVVMIQSIAAMIDAWAQSMSVMVKSNVPGRKTNAIVVSENAKASTKNKISKKKEEKEKCLVWF